MSKFIVQGRPDGIGNRIEQLIHIESYCEKNNKRCVYIWNNTHYRNYPIYIQFKHIDIQLMLERKDAHLPTLQYNTIYTNNNIYNALNHRFPFNIETEAYDTAIHIRGGDRLQLTPLSGDYSTKQELDMCIEKTIAYVNQNEEIKKCILLCENKAYIETIKKYIKKDIYTPPINTRYGDWADFYYMTKASKNIIMCCKFSSFSICASILSNTNLITFFDPHESSLYRYNAKVVKV